MEFDGASDLPQFLLNLVLTRLDLGDYVAAEGLCREVRDEVRHRPEFPEMYLVATHLLALSTSRHDPGFSRTLCDEIVNATDGVVGDQIASSDLERHVNILVNRVRKHPNISRPRLQRLIGSSLSPRELRDAEEAALAWGWILVDEQERKNGKVLKTYVASR